MYSSIQDHYRQTRDRTRALCEGLHVEDYVVQSMPDASPVKWHLAHTTWFFETFILEGRDDYVPFDPSFREVFNSYYNHVGAQFVRERRGTLSRPTVADVQRYRDHVDAAMESAFSRGLDRELSSRVTLGCHHEEQHQELLLTDLKHALGQWASPGFPSGKPYCASPLPAASPRVEGFVDVNEAIVDIGINSDQGFAFDSETPSHRVLVPAFQLARDVIRNDEYCAFIADGGYQHHALWLSDGWAWCQQERIEAPLYWWGPESSTSLAHVDAATLRDPANWSQFTLHGQLPLDPLAPVCHLSFFEAEAFARWAGARLPTEQEWEFAARSLSHAPGGFLESAARHPLGATPADDEVLSGMFGDVWEWTSSAYLPYPGFRPERGALGEYNGKFMNGQRVLRGGSVATPKHHIRASYRNFFPPDKRWQFSGVRLARDV